MGHRCDELSLRGRGKVTPPLLDKRFKKQPPNHSYLRLLAHTHTLERSGPSMIVSAESMERADRAPMPHILPRCRSQWQLEPSTLCATELGTTRELHTSSSSETFQTLPDNDARNRAKPLPMAGS